MACDPKNPIRGGACPIQDTGPPNVYLSLRGAIKNPEALGSSKEGNYETIGKNLGALDYYATSLGEAPQFRGYGIRKAYDTGVECTNMKGMSAHRLADGTAVGVGGYGVVPRLIGSLASLVPGDMVSSATTGVDCKMMMIHENTDAEASAIRGRGMDGVPESNKTPVSGANGVDYRRMDELCRNGTLKGCTSLPVNTRDIDGEEGFRGRRRGGRRGYRSSWRRGHRGYGPAWRPHWRRRRWYNRLPVYYSPPVVVDTPVYYEPRPDVVVVREETPSKETQTDMSDVMPLLILGGVVALGAIFALRR